MQPYAMIIKKRRIVSVHTLFIFASAILSVNVDALVAPHHFDTNRRNVAGRLSSLNSQRSSSNQFLRIQSRTVRGSRQWFDLQTAVMTFSRMNENGEWQMIDLHAQLHFGEQDYFDFYNSKDFASLYDSIHYELLIDEGLMEFNQDGQRQLKSTFFSHPILMASPSDQHTARQYGLVCQVDHINYSHPNWIHADMTRQEMMVVAKTTDTQQPMRILVSTKSTWPGAEAVSALFRPLTPSTPINTPVVRRLFSNLFLPGNALTAVFRSLFWLSIPAPELFVMVLDWSSILPRPSGGISQVALPVLESLLTGNLQEARKLVFGQIVVGGQQSSNEEELLIIKRNKKAVESIQQSLKNKKNRLAVMYGGMHCSDLKSRLIKLGFSPTETLWRTAWSVQVSSFGTANNYAGVIENITSVVSPNTLAFGLVILPLYFLIGGMDWIATLQDVAQQIESGGFLDASIETLLYLVRHVFLYLSLAKFVVEWDGDQSLFGKS